MVLHVAFLDPVHARIRSLVEEVAPADWNIRFTPSSQEHDRQSAVAEAEVAFIIGTGIDSKLLAAAPSLKFVQKLGAGTDNIDLKACALRGIGIARLEAANASQVAEHTVMLMLAAMRRLPFFDRQTRQGQWLRADGRAMQQQLSGKQVGLIGFGAIGRQVAKRLQGFDVTLVYHDIVSAGAELEKALSIVPVGLEELLVSSDIVSLHVPLTTETRLMLDERRINLLKSGAVVINCARGGLIDEATLARAVERSAVSAVGLDTHQVEPTEYSPLFARDEVVVTPHLAGATVENFAVVFKRGVENARLFLSGYELAPAETVLDQRAHRKPSQAISIR